MKVYLINLDKDVERLAVADARLKALGVSYERVSAVYAKTLPQEARDAAVNKFRWWCAMARLPWIGEIGCAMSHYLIYRQMTEPVCVLEDDVILNDRFPEVLRYVEERIDVSRAQVVLLSNHVKGDKKRTVDYAGTPCLEPIRFDMYSEGYVITPKAAQVLLRANMPMQVPCDHWGRWVRLGLIELFHALPTVCSQDQSQGVSGTVDPNCVRVSDMNIIRKIIHKFKRVVGKTIDGVLLGVERFRFRV